MMIDDRCWWMIDDCCWQRIDYWWWSMMWERSLSFTMQPVDICPAFVQKNRGVFSFLYRFVPLHVTNDTWCCALIVHDGTVWCSWSRTNGVIFDVFTSLNISDYVIMIKMVIELSVFSTYVYIIYLITCRGFDPDSGSHCHWYNTAAKGGFAWT